MSAAPISNGDAGLLARRTVKPAPARRFAAGITTGYQPLKICELIVLAVT